MMRLQTAQLEAAQDSLPDWQLDPAHGGTLRRCFVFRDFAQAFGFMTQVAIEAARRDHHPEWFHAGNRVDVCLTTHEVQGLSCRDVELARHMDHLAAGLRDAQAC